MSETPARHYRLTRPDGLGFFRRRSAPQFVIACGGVALLTLALVLRAAGAPGRTALLLVGLGALALGAGRTPSGEDVVDLVAPLARFGLRRARGEHRFVAALAPWGGPPLPPLFSGIELLDFATTNDSYRAIRRDRAGVVVDRGDGSVSVVLRVHGDGFLLAEHLEQDERLACFGAALASIAQEESVLTRCSWSQFVAPASLDAHLAYLAATERDDPDPLLRSSYLGLLDSLAPTLVTAEVLVTLTASLSRIRSGRGQDRIALCSERLMEEATLFSSELTRAGLAIVGPLPCGAIARALRERLDPVARAGLSRRSRSLADAVGLVTPGNGFPLATEEHRRSIRIDASFHRLFRIAEWPRTPVRADWLAGLLCEREVGRSLSVSFVPQPRREARRQALAVATRVGANIDERETKGRRVGAEERRAQVAAEALDEELEQGAAMELVLGLLDVTAPDLAGLESACERTLQSAADAGIELRPVDLRHGEALVASLPLGRAVSGRAR